MWIIQLFFCIINFIATFTALQIYHTRLIPVLKITNSRRVLLVRPNPLILQNQNRKPELQKSRVRVFPKFIVEAQLNSYNQFIIISSHLFSRYKKSKFYTFTWKIKLLEKKQSATASLLHRVDN